MKTKIIDGKTFTLWNTYNIKSQAEDVAYTCRLVGDLARVVKTKEGYELYTLEESRKKKVKDNHDDEYIPYYNY